MLQVEADVMKFANAVASWGGLACLMMMVLNYTLHSESGKNRPGLGSDIFHKHICLRQSAFLCDLDEVNKKYTEQTLFEPTFPYSVQPPASTFKGDGKDTFTESRQDFVNLKWFSFA
ncbi:hypothetical protein AB6A40_008356 [Gnathostoma spinigerum]|uniref:Uncharacterized protein n=1 Tax=Gnathostoma spinigerum TaxID=75299 RepID=A0ABD6EY75_9BILA